MIQVGDRVRRARAKSGYNGFYRGLQEWVVEQKHTSDTSGKEYALDPEGRLHYLENLEKVETMLDVKQSWAYRKAPTIEVEVRHEIGKDYDRIVSVYDSEVIVHQPDGHRFSDPNRDLVPLSDTLDIWIGLDKGNNITSTHTKEPTAEEKRMMERHKIRFVKTQVPL